MGIQLTLAARYLAGRRLRAILTTLAVIFGVLVLFGMNIIVPTMMRAVQSTMMAASDQVDMTATLTSGESFATAAVEKVRAVSGVRAAQGILERPVNLPADFFDHNPATPDKVSVVSLIGIDPARARGVRPYPLTGGRFLEPTDGAAAIISANFAQSLGITIGGSVSLPTVQGLVRLTVVGLRAPRAVPGNEEVLVTLPEAQQLLSSEGQINTIEANDDATDAARRAQIKDAVQAALGSSFTLGTLSDTSSLYGSLGAAQIGFTAFGILALFMGAFIIFNTFRTIVAERRRDMGMLRAIGASHRTVVGIFILEGLMQGVLGTAIGMLLGYLLALAATASLGPMLSQFVHLTMGLPIVSPGIVIVSVVVGIGVTLGAGIFPALAARKVTPIEALRPSTDAAVYRRAIGGSAIAGIVLVALALAALSSGSMSLLALGMIMFMVGIVLLAPALVRPLSLVFGALLARLFARRGTGTLAQQNLARQPSRAAVTASTTMIALAIIVAMGGMMASVSAGFLGVLRTSLGSDYLFVPPAVAVWQNDVGASGALAESLRKIDGVDHVSTLRYASTILDTGKTHNSAALLGVEPKEFPLVSSLAFTEGSSEKAFAALAGGRGLIANPMLAASLGLKVGGTVVLDTAEGKKDYRVVGIATDFLDAKIAAAFVSQASLAQDFHKTEDVLIQLNLKSGADATAADAAIRAAGAQYPQFSIVQGKDYYAQMSGLFTVIFTALYVLFAFLALPSLLTTLNTLAISVIERTREIGMLRAVGMTRRQVSRTVLAESLLLAALGILFGLIAGLYLGYLLVKGMTSAGFPAPYVFPGAGLIAAVVIGLVFGALAAIIPARKAAELEIVDALRYE